MKIKLDETEIMAVVKEWAMMTHNSRNVSGMFQIDVTPAVLGPRGKQMAEQKVNNVYIELEVVVGEGQYAGQSSQLANQAVNRAKDVLSQRKFAKPPLPTALEQFINSQPDLSPTEVGGAPLV